MLSKFKGLSIIGLVAIFLTSLYSAIILSVTFANKKKIDYLYNKEKFDKDFDFENNWNE